MTPFNNFQFSALSRWNALKSEDASKEKQFISLPPSAKVSFIYDFLESENLFPDVVCSSTKSTAKALEYKTSGNEFFVARRDIEALKMYTKSVSVALPDSPELAVAYANRSAALYKLGRYAACLVDINRSMGGRYPETSKPKLLDRKKYCISKLETMNASSRSRLKSLASSVSDDYTLEQNLEHKLADCEYDVDATDMNYARKFYLPTTHFNNKIIPFASEKMKLDHNSSMGRHVVATADIEPGEVLSFERAHVSILNFKYRYSHCSNCFVRCEALIPCDTCSMVMYCSVKCREEALDRYHLLECPILQNAVQLKMEEGAWLAIRILLIATKHGQEIETLMSHPVYKDPMRRTRIDLSKKFDPQDYLQIHNMEMNIEKQPARNWYPCSLMAALMLNILKMSEFFSSLKDDEARKTKPTAKAKEMFEFVGNLLLKFYLSLMCNVQGILEATKTGVTNIGQFSIETTSIGCGIYSFHCLFNHSCDANVTIHSHKDAIVFCSNQPIKAGEQIFTNYGGFYYDVPRDERQSLFRKIFFFECCCKACEKNWPVWENLKNIVKKKLPRLEGKKLVELHENIRKWKISKSDPFSAKVLRDLREMLLWLRPLTEKPFLEHVECQYLIRTLFWCRANCYGLPQDKILLSL